MEHILLPPPEPRPSGNATAGLNRRELKKLFASYTYHDIFEYCQAYDPASVATLLISGERMFPPERSEYSNAIQYAKYQWLIAALISLAVKIAQAQEPQEESPQLNILPSEEGLTAVG